MGIVAGCLVTLRPLFRRLFPGSEKDDPPRIRQPGFTRMLEDVEANPGDCRMTEKHNPELTIRNGNPAGACAVCGCHLESMHENATPSRAMKSKRNKKRRSGLPLAVFETTLGSRMSRGSI